MMHQCLSVEDVLRIILDSLFNDARHRQSVRAVIALATTCRAFHDLALDTIWESQTSCVPLIRCLPASVWRETPSTGFDRDLTLLRPVVEADLVRFDYYARRIKNLEYYPFAWHSNKSHMVDLRIMKEIARLRGGQPVLPNLRRLRLSKEKFARAAFPIFLNQGVVALTLDWKEDEGSSTSLLPLIPLLAPYLEDLDCGNWADDVSIESRALSDLFPKLPLLRSVSSGVRGINIAGIRSLGALSYLRTLRIPNTAQRFLQALGSATTQPFKALRCLSLRADDLQSFSSLLARLQPLHLETIRIELKCNPSSTEFEHFCDTFTSSIDHATLREVRIVHSVPNRIDPLSTLTVSTNDLVKFLVFKNMKIFDFTLTTTFIVDNSCIKQMAESWPKLEQLFIGSPLGWRTRSIDLAGLLPLVSGCPQLEALRLCVDASQRVPSELVASTGARNEKIKYLHVADSGISDPPAVALFLNGIFPRLKGIGGAWLYEPPKTFPPMQQEEHAMWYEVMSLLRGG